MVATPPRKASIQYANVEVPAWVLVGYPRYAPQIVDIITMDEVVYDVAVRNFGYEPYMYGTAPFSGTQTPPDPSDEKALGLWREKCQWNPDYYPYFYRDIWPILQRPNNYQWVMDFDVFTGGDPHNTTSGTGGNFDQIRSFHSAHQWRRSRPACADVRLGSFEKAGPREHLGLSF